jgi:gamma-glutamyltranspeptidase/glutathione hydrolase
MTMQEFTDASDRSGHDVNLPLYSQVSKILFRGKLAANTGAGAVSTWNLAYKKNHSQ